jgi:predicted PurR-regulated permease PerM
MDKSNELGKGSKYIIFAASLVIIFAGINLAQSVIVLILVSIFFSLLGAPPVLWLKTKKIPSSLAVFIVMFCMVIILMLIGAQIGRSFSGFSEDLPLLQLQLKEQVIEISKYLTAKGVAVNEKFFMEYINPESIMILTASLLTGLSSILSDIVLILLTVTFILLEVSSFPLKLRAILGDPNQAFPQFNLFINDMKRYMLMKTILSLITGIFIGMWLFIFGVDYPLLWGFLAFLLNYIPNLGSIIAAVPATILSLIQLGFEKAIIVLVGYILVNFIIGNLLEPKLMGRKLGLSTLIIFVSLIFWGSLLGLVGAILCIPLTITAKFAFEGNEKTRWIAIILDSEKQVRYTKR